MPQTTLSDSERKLISGKPNWLSQSWLSAVSQRTLNSALALSPPAPSVRRVLHLGCGDGKFLGRLLEKYPHAFMIGVELNQAALSEAKAHLRFHSGHWSLMQAAPQRLNMPSASVNLLHCHYLLHRMAAPTKSAIIREMARVLKPGGMLIISDFCRDISKWNRRWSEFISRPKPTQQKGDCSWVKELEESGFAIQHKRHRSQNRIQSYLIKAVKA